MTRRLPAGRVLKRVAQGTGVAVLAAAATLFGLLHFGATGPINAHANTCWNPSARQDAFDTFRGRYRVHVWYVVNRCDQDNGYTQRNYEIGTDLRDPNNTNNYQNVSTLDEGARVWACGQQVAQRGIRYNNSAYVDAVSPWFNYGPSSNPCGPQADALFHYVYSDSKYTTVYVNENGYQAQSIPQCPDGGTDC